MLPPEFMGMFPPPPLPGHPFKFPPHMTPHLRGPHPDGMEFFPPIDPYLARHLPPGFFAGHKNDMLLDMLPPHFFPGVPPMFPGFRPPR